MMGWGLNRDGRRRIWAMVESHGNGPNIREWIKEIEVSDSDFDYEANVALARKLEDGGYTQTAQYLRERINS